MTGLVLGKFMPVHAGHQLLIDAAVAVVGKRALTVVVGTQPDEPIPGPLRCAWVRDLYPRVTVLHLDRPMPQEPADHPDFWDLWVGVLRSLVPVRPDLVFTSESYGDELARQIGARHVPVDPARTRVPVSGRAIRRQPLAHWPTGEGLASPGDAAGVGGRQNGPAPPRASRPARLKPRPTSRP